MKIPLPPENTLEFFDPDFHSGEACAPLMHLLGVLTIDWSFCEHLFSTLIWEYVGDTQKGYSVTAALGNQSRADLLFDLARQSERSKAVIARLEFAAKVFNILRETRNSLVHSHSVIPHESGKLEWLRQASSKARVTGCLAGYEELTETHQTIQKLVRFITDIHIYHLNKKTAARRPRLPRIFPIPKKLTQSSLPDQPAAQSALKKSRNSASSKRPKHSKA